VPLKTERGLAAISARSHLAWDARSMDGKGQGPEPWPFPLAFPSIGLLRCGAENIMKKNAPERTPTREKDISH